MFAREGHPPVDVLIADDDPLTRQAFRLILEGRGYGCAEAADGAQAVELAQRVRPRCVLLDVAMPVMGGLAAARLLRADPLTRSVRIHCVTGLTDPLTRAEARQAGCERFLTKPVELDELLDAVREPAERFGFVSGLTLSQAEELLDWLQNHGCTSLEVMLDGSGATVRCLCPPGSRLVVDADGTARLVEA
jgi:CheY-like chemotaxis protein